MITDFFRLFAIAFVFLFFASVTLDSKATVIEAFTDDWDSKILYQDGNIFVTDKGVYSVRTKKLIIFQEDPNWEEEDFFTQQEKYCEKESK